MRCKRVLRKLFVFGTALHVCRFIFHCPHEGINDAIISVKSKTKKNKNRIEIAFRVRFDTSS